MYIYLFADLFFNSFFLDEWLIYIDINKQEEKYTLRFIEKKKKGNEMK